MTIYYFMVFFILGTIFGSFYNVVGSRLSRGESIVFPPSHCNNCNHRLTPIELIPIFSFLIQGGKCKNCKIKLSWFYPIHEFMTGMLFALAYLKFGFSLEIILALTFISMIMIIIVSDYEEMIIPDEVLIVFNILLVVEIFFIKGFNSLLISLLYGVISMLVMFLIKKFGDFMFKKESMGGGDIKLLFTFGLVLGIPMSFVSIFLASFIGLPISVILLYNKKSHIIPFGPFLGIGAIIILLLGIDVNWLMNLYHI